MMRARIYRKPGFNWYNYATQIIQNHKHRVPGLLFVFSAIYLIVKIQHEAVREHPVYATPFDPLHDDVIDATKLKDLGPTVHGSLGAHIVEDPDTGTQYVKKSAHSPVMLKNEFMYANFFYAINPDRYPRSRLAQH